jgi:hypothetical protein
VPSDALRVYLQDHHAAAAAGLALCRRLFGEAHPLTEAITRDRETLEEVMRRLDVTARRPKVALALLGEQLGRLRGVGPLTRQPELGRLLGLETLFVGIHGKRALWTALALERDPRLEDVDLQALAASAATQAVEVDAARLSAAGRAFASGPEPQGATT